MEKITIDEETISTVLNYFKGKNSDYFISDTEKLIAYFKRCIKIKSNYK